MKKKNVESRIGVSELSKAIVRAYDKRVIGAQQMAELLMLSHEIEEALKYSVVSPVLTEAIKALTDRLGKKEN